VVKIYVLLQDNILHLPIVYTDFTYFVIQESM